MGSGGAYLRIFRGRSKANPGDFARQKSRRGLRKTLWKFKNCVIHERNCSHLQNRSTNLRFCKSIVCYKMEGREKGGDVKV